MTPTPHSPPNGSLAMETSTVQKVSLPPNLCQEILNSLRKLAKDYKHIDKEEEPPLRKLSFGLKGEGVECEEPPYSYMIKSKNGLWYHGYRFDQSLCDEAAHTSPRLNKIFGSPTESRGTYFRQVLGYGARTKTQMKDSCQDWIEKLSEIVLPACLSVYKEAKVARLFSV